MKVVLLDLRLLLLTTVKKYPFSFGLYHYLRLMLELLSNNFVNNVVFYLKKEIICWHLEIRET